MKKMIALLLCMFLLAVSFVACGNKNEGEDTSNTGSLSVEQSESETDEEDEEEYTAPSFEETDPPKISVEEKVLGEAGDDGEGDWSGYYPKN